EIATPGQGGASTRAAVEWRIFSRRAELPSQTLGRAATRRTMRWRTPTVHSGFSTSLGMLVALSSMLAGGVCRAEETEPPPPLEKPNGLPGQIFITAIAKPEGTLNGLVAVNPGELSWSVARPVVGQARISPDGRSVAFMHRDKDVGF